jgi:hypothetical protein
MLSFQHFGEFERRWSIYLFVLNDLRRLGWGLYAFYQHIGQLLFAQRLCASNCHYDWWHTELQRKHERFGAEHHRWRFRVLLFGRIKCQWIHWFG